MSENLKSHLVFDIKGLSENDAIGLAYFLFAEIKRVIQQHEANFEPNDYTAMMSSGFEIAFISTQTEDYSTLLKASQQAYKTGKTLSPEEIEDLDLTRDEYSRRIMRKLKMYFQNSHIYNLLEGNNIDGSPIIPADLTFETISSIKKPILKLYVFDKTYDSKKLPFYYSFGTESKMIQSFEDGESMKKKMGITNDVFLQRLYLDKSVISDIINLGSIKNSWVDDEDEAKNIFTLNQEKVVEFENAKRYFLRTYLTQYESIHNIFYNFYDDLYFDVRTGQFFDKSNFIRAKASWLAGIDQSKKDRAAQKEILADSTMFMSYLTPDDMGYGDSDYYGYICQLKMKQNIGLLKVDNEINVRKLIDDEETEEITEAFYKFKISPPSYGWITRDPGENYLTIIFKRTEFIRDDKTFDPGFFPNWMTEGYLTTFFQKFCKYITIDGKPNPIVKFDSERKSFSVTYSNKCEEDYFMGRAMITQYQVYNSEGESYLLKGGVKKDEVQKFNNKGTKGNFSPASNASSNSRSPRSVKSISPEQSSSSSPRLFKPASSQQSPRSFSSNKISNTEQAASSHQGPRPTPTPAPSQNPWKTTGQAVPAPKSVWGQKANQGGKS